VLVYFVNHSTAPINLGGAERSLIKLVEDWYASDPDFEAVFITKHPRGQFIRALEERQWAFKSFRYRGWTVPRNPAPVSEMTYFAREDYASTRMIVSMMEERRPDLVVTNTIVAPWGAFAANLLGIPHAWMVREYGDLDHGLAFQTSRAETFSDIGLLSDAVFANSLAVKSHIGQYLDESKVTVVYPQIDTKQLDEKAAEALPAPAFPVAAPDDLKITVVGRLSDTKGQWRVVDAIGELKRRGATAHLCLVGSWTDNDYDLQLRARARALGVDSQLTIVGEQENPFPFVAAADVCVTASTIEAFGRTTLEYMLAAKPAIASTGGGGSELVVDGATGALFDPERTDTLVEALMRYVGDRDSITTHGAAARGRALELMTSEYSNLRAIERLKRTAAATDVYRLPNIARHWFALPGYFHSASKTKSQEITVRFIMTRLKGRLKNYAKKPVSAVRRAVKK